MPLEDWLDDAAENDLGEGGDPARRDVKLLATVVLVAGSMLLLEVLLAKLFPFFLGDVSSFVAIPVAMFGLSLGALALHRRPDTKPRAIAVLLPALLATTLGAFVGLFLLFDHVFNLTHHALQSPPHNALKTTVFSLLFVPPFALAGVVLSLAFRAGATVVGRLYAADLFGSAAACVATPVLLHFTDLPVVICLLLTALWAANVVLFSRYRAALVGVGGPALLALGFAASRQWVFVEHPDPDVLGVRYSEGHEVVEHAHRWNEVSRVALVSFAKEGEETTWRLMHDDGVSNVTIRSYDPALVANPPAHDGVTSLPFRLDRPPKTALVIFAGAGRDMLHLFEQAGGELDVTGVEINPLVPALALSRDDLFHLSTFYALPNVHHVVDEGRAFLNRSTDRYDLIMAGSNGAESAVRTGHVRKFLDTEEAATAYLDHLSPGGTLVFFAQPYRLKLEMFKRRFEERGLAPLKESVIAIGKRSKPNLDAIDSLFVKPGGFTPAEVERVAAEVRASGLYVHYAPGQRSAPELTRLVAGSPKWTQVLPDDDRPYERPLRFSGFTPFPRLDRFRSLEYSQDWIKIFTALFFAAASALTIGAFYLPRAGRPRLPAWAAAWFLVSGVAYMLAEIGLMTKLELFLGLPLYSIAVVLASFLLSNAVGSAWVGRRQAAGRPVPAALPPLAAVLLVPATLIVVDQGLMQLLGLPVTVKAALAVLAITPLGVVLGMFYPVGVGLVTARGLSELVPMTFGLATLSSVVGSTLAIVSMINLGFRTLVLAADGVYLGVLLAVLLAGALAGTRTATAPSA